MQKIIHYAGLFSLCILSLTALLQSCASDGRRCSYLDESMLQHSEDRVELCVRSDSLIVDVQSMGGIGRCELQVPRALHYRQVVLQLHLKGLEQLTVETDSASIRIAIGSGTQPRILQSYRSSPGSNWVQLTADEICWAEIDIVSAARSLPVIPLEDGYFRIVLPCDLIFASSRPARISWIDFFR